MLNRIYNKKGQGFSPLTILKSFCPSKTQTKYCVTLDLEMGKFVFFCNFSHHNKSKS